jgi:hypothetical protein
VTADAATFVVQQWFADHDPAYVHCGAVTYAGPLACLAVMDAARAVRGCVVRISLWRDGTCSERWERSTATGRAMFEKFTRTLDAEMPGAITLGGPWTATGIVRSTLDFEAELQPR